MAIGPTNCNIRPVFETGESFINGDLVESTMSTTSYRALYLAEWEDTNAVQEIDHALHGKERITVFITADILPYPLEANQYIYVTKDGMVNQAYPEKKYRIFKIPMEPVKYIAVWELLLVEAE